MSDLLPCALCGFEGHRDREVRLELVAYREPDPKPEGWKPYDHVPRCVDRAACRERVAAIPEPWPLVEEPS